MFEAATLCASVACMCLAGLLYWPLRPVLARVLSRIERL